MHPLKGQTKKIKSFLRAREASYLELILHADWWEEAGMNTTAEL